MSIYIAIPTMYDNQIPFTVFEAIQAAANPDDLTIGLVLMETAHPDLDYEFYYKDKIEKLLEFPQVKFKRFKVGEYEPSIGFGRDQALSMYGGEDYILQVDSHTLFEKNWDTRLIKMYEGALEATQNSKTIMTAYLPGFKHLDSGERVPLRHDKIAQYPIMIFRTWNNTGIPAWKDEPLAGPDSHQYRSDELYVPAVKFNAQFVFSNKHYFGNTGLDIDTIFWEEEIIQTMSLLEAGFSLVFPNMTIPLSHLFQNNTSFEEVLHPTYRVSGANPNMLSNVEYYDNIRDNWVKYVTNPANKSKVDRFCQYTKINLKYGPFKEGYIPKEFNR